MGPPAGPLASNPHRRCETSDKKVWLPQSFQSQGDCRIDARGAARRDVVGQRRGAEQHGDGAAPGEDVRGPHAVGYELVA